MRYSVIRMDSALWIVALFWVLASSPAWCKDRFDFSGYYKNFSIAYHLPAFSATGHSFGQSWLGSVSNRVRLNGYSRISDGLNFEASYNIAPRIQDNLLFTQDVFSFGIAPFGYRVDDLNERPYPEGDKIKSFAVYQNLDRAYLTIAFKQADVYLGRQAIAWGSARMINPTDVIAPYAFTELDSEDRIGIDAIRMRIPVGFMGEVDLGYAVGKDFNFENSAMFVRGRCNIRQTDLSAMVVSFRENLMVGVDFARSVGDAGFWFESGYVFVDALTETGNGHGDDYLRLSSGLDYSLGPNTYGFVEYHFNQAGSNDFRQYPDVMKETAYTEGSVYLMGKHYLIPGVTHQVSALVGGSVELLVNLGDPSLSITPNVEYNIATDIYLAAGAYIGLGDSPDMVIPENNGSTLAEFETGSEFGAYPDIFYTAFRVYF